MRFEILPGLPPYGPMAVNFSVHGPREHREGLVVRFYPKNSEPWVGNFVGGMSACNAVLDYPGGDYVIVVAQGDACILDPERRIVLDRIAGDIKQVISVSSLGSVVFQRLTDFIAIRDDNSGWHSPRISWDGFRNIEVHEATLLGEAYTPNGNYWAPFQLDLLTGHCTDGIYEKEMSEAGLIARDADRPLN
ncbi:hypothetical protein JJE66_01515 [Bradyrhizobium diazoefficiens]|uniref:hypothetical protein n=1 Tax=Bradyrhizobium diazoefficiens TaxID=1355477 RepID=UPI00190D3EFA|nr:hypothetical protein [Bradyrhizobium diazoefficiens]MBK3659934.1 hypothetical protein [Bradyrhizobium diazoefficiens]